MSLTARSVRQRQHRTADLQYTPLAQRGGIGRAHHLFGNGLAPLLEELNLELVR